MFIVGDLSSSIEYHSGNNLLSTYIVIISEAENMTKIIFAHVMPKVIIFLSFFRLSIFEIVLVLLQRFANKSIFRINF